MLIAIGEGTLELHASLFLAKGTVFGDDLVLDYPLQDMVVSVPVFELDLVVFDFYEIE